MTIRKATPNDFSKIISIYAHAREQMRLSGNPNQWGSTNPSEETIKNDIKNGYSYVITDTDSPAIFGVFAFIIGKDPTYEYIENGSWLNDDLYGTIHRIAGSGEKKGVFRCCLAFCESKAANIRIDTHEENYAMQHLLAANGFQKCGRIYVADKSPRIAYQKVL